MKNCFIRILACILYLPTHLARRNHKKLVFGAWHGSLYTGNPRYLFEWLSLNTDWTLVWIGERTLAPLIPHVRTGILFAPRGSLSALWHVLTASAFVYCHSFWEDIGPYPVKRKLIYLNTTHGIPFKKMGDENVSQSSSPGSGIINKIQKKIDPVLFREETTACVSSEDMEEAFRLAWPEMFKKFIHTGTPRIDFLIEAAHDRKLVERLREKYAKTLGVSVEKRWVLYMPTYRSTTTDLFSFSLKSTDSKLAEVLSLQNALIIEKLHFNSLQVRTVEKDTAEICIIDQELSEKVDATELLLACDWLITDYSSCFFDFALINRPVIHFAYDYEFYRNSDTGLRYELYDIAAGPVCESYETLIQTLAKPENEILASRGSKLDGAVRYETGTAREQIHAWLEQQGIG